MRCGQEHVLLNDLELGILLRKLHFRRQGYDILGGNGFPSLSKTLGTSKCIDMMCFNVYFSIPK